MKQLLSMAVPALALSTLAACSGSSGPSANLSVAGAASSPSTTTPPGKSNPAPTSAAAVGESCLSSDPTKICLGVHFVTYKDPRGTPTATEAQAATIIHTMNTLWAQCNIGFQIEKYEQVDPTTSGLSYGAASQNELNQIRTAYQSPTNELLAVTTGPWGTTVNAWTNMPGDGIYGAIMEASIVTYGNGIIYAHEFGHYLGLDHVADTTDLMNAVIYTTSTKLDSGQCQTAQSTANSYWMAMFLK